MSLLNEELNNTIPLAPPFPEWTPRIEESARPVTTPDEFSGAMPPASDEHDESSQQEAAPGDAHETSGNREILQPAMRIEIPAVPTPSTETTDGFFKFRPWQATCFTELAGHCNFIVNAPTAGGKAFEICAIASERLSRDSDLKVVIAVPQTIIAAGFRHNKIELPDGTRIRWDVHQRNNLCGKNKGGQRTGRLLEFLTRANSQAAMDRVVLCTHATLVRAFSKDAAAFKNVLIIVDEAHHVQHSTDQDGRFDILNQLGALVKHALKHRDVIQLGLATATFFRGDRTSIIPEGAEFARFDLPYDEYLETCQFLRSLTYDFIVADGSFVDPLKRLFDQRIGKTIIYTPVANSSSSLGTKMANVIGVLKAIAGIDTPIVADSDRPIMRVRRGERWLNVIDLVDETNRAQKLEAIDNAHNSPNGRQIDIVIALGMLKEGANWRWADREIIIGRRGSLMEILHMVGRLLRDVAGKTNVEVFHILPFRFDQLDREQTRQDLNDYLAAILLSMLLENVVNPIYSPRTKGHDGHGGGERRINYLKEAFPDETQATAALAEITARIVDASAKDCTSRGIQDLKKALPAIVAEVLTSFGIREYHEEIARQLYGMFSRRTLAMQGLNVGQVGVDLVKDNPLGCLLHYVSNACGINTFRELRCASRAPEFRNFDEARSFVRGLHLKSSTEWLRYCGSGERPPDIPSNPQATYKGGGWVGSRDWLGTGTTRNFRCFPEARLFVHGLQLSSWTEWKKYCSSGEKPADIPTKPNATYKHEGWVGYGDWLGTGRTRDFRGFVKARLFARGLRLKSAADWRKYCTSGNKPCDIPSNPSSAYKFDGWVNFPDWLGAGHARTLHRGFQEARAFVHTLALKSEGEWMQYSQSGKKPTDIPSQPYCVYKEAGWSGYADWLGTGKVCLRDVAWRLFHEARDFVRGLHLDSQLAWVEYCKSGGKPPDLPTNPNVIYRATGWNGYRDWLGPKETVRISSFRAFLDAREYVCALRLKSYTEWRQFCNSGDKPKDIPSCPAGVYTNRGWNGWGDWLGTGNVAPRNHVFRSFAAARQYVHGLGLTSAPKWKVYCKTGRKPDDIPSTPSYVYRNAGWAGYADWLKGGVNVHVSPDELNAADRTKVAQFSLVDESPN